MAYTVKPTHRRSTIGSALTASKIKKDQSSSVAIAVWLVRIFVIQATKKVTTKVGAVLIL